MPSPVQNIISVSKPNLVTNLQNKLDHSGKCRIMSVYGYSYNKKTNEKQI